MTAAEADRTIDKLRYKIGAVDTEITPLAIESGSLRNQAWGPLMRSGNDKSLFARQVERYADVYTCAPRTSLRSRRTPTYAPIGAASPTTSRSTPARRGGTTKSTRIDADGGPPSPSIRASTV